MVIAALAMYDWPEVRAHTDHLWQAIAARLRAFGMAVPEQLVRDRSPEAVWTDPDLLIAQACGYPYVMTLRGRVRVVATPCYMVDGCEGPDYRSQVLVRADEAQSLDLLRLLGRRAAINDRASHSGCLALRTVIAPLAGGQPYFGKVIETGSHRASMAAVAEGHADVCAVDPVCWALARRYMPDMTGALRILAMSPQAPGLPLITAAGRSTEEVGYLRAALNGVLSDPALAPTRAALFLTGIVAADDEAYDRISEMETQTRALGFGQLA